VKTWFQAFAFTFTLYRYAGGSQNLRQQRGVYEEAVERQANPSTSLDDDELANANANVADPVRGGAVQVDFSLPIAWKRMVSTLEPIKRSPGFKVCFEMGQLVPLQRGSFDDAVCMPLLDLERLTSTSADSFGGALHVESS
jgi:hypothetical protein